MRICRLTRAVKTSPLSCSKVPPNRRNGCSDGELKVHPAALRRKAMSSSQNCRRSVKGQCLLSDEPSIVLHIQRAAAQTQSHGGGTY